MVEARQTVHASDISDLLSAIASSKSSCSCCFNLASRSFSSLSLSLFAHSIMSSSVGYYKREVNLLNRAAGMRLNVQTRFGLIGLNYYYN